jgi:proton-coupled amino acid transporter
MILDDDSRHANLLPYDPVPTDKGGAAVLHHGTSWQRICAIIIANMLGTGVLSMPYAASVMGWIPAAVLLLAFAMAALYSGLLYARLYQAVPQAKSLTDIATIAWGQRGKRVVGTVAYVYIGGVTVIFHLTATLAINAVFYDVAGLKCAWVASAGVAALMLLLLQVRDMGDVGALAAAGTVAIAAPLVIILVVLISGKGGAPDDDDDDDESQTNALSTFGVAAMDVAFAFAGQVIFIELQSDMARPQDFPKAVAASLSVMAPVYGVIGAVGFAAIGKAALANGKPITSQLEEGTILRVVNAFLAFHVIVAYVIEGNVLARAIMSVLPRGGRGGGGNDGRPGWWQEPEGGGNDDDNRGEWRIATVLVVGIAFTLSNLVPFFSDVMGLAAALCAILLSFTFPMLLGKELIRNMTPREVLITNLALPVTVAVAIAGTAASVASIVGNLSSGKPFQC